MHHMCCLMKRCFNITLVAVCCCAAPAQADAPRDITVNQRLWLDGLDVNGTDTGNGGGTNPVGIVTTWQDKSANSFVAGDATSLSAVNRSLPSYIVGQGVSFDGNWDVMEIPSGIYGDGAVVTQSDFYFVATTRQQINSFIFAQNPTFNNPNRITAHLPWGDGTIFWDHTCCGVGRLTASWAGTGSVFNQAYLWNLSAGPGQEIWRDGTVLASSGTTGTYTELAGDNFYIGGAENGTGNNHDGVVSELIVYNRQLVDAERRILLSYLNAKYQPPGGIGADIRFANGAGFNFHVGGIGQESNGALATGTSAGLTISNSGWLANGRYLLAGLDSLNPASGTSISDLPSGSALRASRVWFLDNNAGGAGNVTLSFNLTQFGVTANAGEEWQLLFRSGTSGAFSVLQQISFAGGAALDFTVPNPADGYYTIARRTNIDINVAKSSFILADGISAANPKALPGAEVQYSVNIVNNLDAPDSNSLLITDILPANIDLFVGDFAAGAPYALVEGSPPCGFAVPFASLSSSSDAINFLDGTGSVVTPAPDADGFDSNVRSIEIMPTGQLSAFSGSGSQPNCVLNFKARIKE